MVQKGIQYCELDALLGCAGFFSNRIFMKKNHSFLPVILLFHLKYGTIKQNSLPKTRKMVRTMEIIHWCKMLIMCLLILVSIG